MRKILLSIALLVCALSGYSQKIVTGEYFFNNDPGKGEGTEISFEATSTVELDLNIPLDETLPLGPHRLYFRFKDENGKWSHNYARTIFIDRKQENDKIIMAIEYYIDSVGNPGEGTIINIDKPAEAVSLDQEMDLSDLDYGVHHLYVRALNQAGKWGEYTRRSIHVTPDADNKIESLSYYYTSEDEASEMYTYVFKEPARVIETNVLLEANNLVENKEYTLHLIANSQRGVNSFKVSRGFMFLVNNAPELLKAEESLSLYEEASETLSMKTLFTDKDFSIGDSLAYEITDASPAALGDFISWSDHNTLEILPEAGHQGKYSFNIEATDKAGALVSILVNLTVLPGETSVNGVITEKAFLVYPNPASEYLNIENISGELEDFQLRMYNLQGQLIVAEKIDNSFYTLSLTGFSKGIYLLELTYNSYTLKKRIVIE